MRKQQSISAGITVMLRKCTCYVTKMYLHTKWAVNSMNSCVAMHRLLLGASSVAFFVHRSHHHHHHRNRQHTQLQHLENTLRTIALFIRSFFICEIVVRGCNLTTLHYSTTILPSFYAQASGAVVLFQICCCVVLFWGRRPWVCSPLCAIQTRVCAIGLRNALEAQSNTCEYEHTPTTSQE